MTKHDFTEEEKFIELLNEFLEQNINHKTPGYNFHEAELTKDNFAHIMFNGFSVNQDTIFTNYISNLIDNDINNLANQHGWFVAKNFVHEEETDVECEIEVVHFVDIMPLFGEPHHPDGRWIYHVTSQNNLTNIQQNGLKPQQGGRDFISFQTPRLYLSGDCVTVDIVIGDLRKHRKVTNFEILRFPAGSVPVLEFWKDYEFDGIQSFWTDQIIPSKLLQRYEGNWGDNCEEIDSFWSDINLYQ